MLLFLRLQLSLFQFRVRVRAQALRGRKQGAQALVELDYPFVQHLSVLSRADTIAGDYTRPIRSAAAAAIIAGFIETLCLTLYKDSR